MKFTKPTMIALAAAPIIVSSWSFGPTYYSIPLMLESATPVERVLKQQQQRMIAKRMLDQQIGHPSQQHYELIDNDEKFQLTVDVPGVKEEDIDIKLDEGQLTIKGQRVATSESSRSTSKFSQSFSLDLTTVDVDHFTATLKNGVLVVTAPKDLAKLEEKVRRIPITTLEDILADHANQDEKEISAADHTSSHEEQKERDDVEIPLDSPTTTTTAEDDTSVAPNDDEGEGEGEGEKTPV